MYLLLYYLLLFGACVCVCEPLHVWRYSAAHVVAVVFSFFPPCVGSQKCVTCSKNMEGSSKLSSVNKECLKDFEILFALC